MSLYGITNTLKTQPQIQNAIFRPTARTMIKER